MKYLEKILAIIIILILIYNIYMSNKIFNLFCEGLWTGSDEFCNDSKIDGMILYIGPYSYNFLNITRKAYLIMYANDAVMVNKKFEISYFLNLSPFLKNSIELTFLLKDPSEDETLEIIEESDPSLIKLDTIMPLTQNVKIELDKGKMIWSNDETIYANLLKNPT